MSGIGRYAHHVTEGLGLRRLPLEGRAGTPLAPVQISGALRRTGDADYFLSMGFSSPLLRSVPYSIFIYGLMQRDPSLGFPRYYRAYYDTVVRRGARRAEFIFTISEQSADAIREWLADEGPTIVNVGAGVEPHFSVQPGASTPDRPSILYVGSMNANKGFEDLAAAFAALDEPDARLTVVTRGRDRALEVLTSEGIPPQRVHLVSDVSDEALVALYNEATVTVVPSHSEGFGLPVAEARACGSPVICRDTPIFREVDLGGVRFFASHDELVGLLREGLARAPLDVADRDIAAQVYRRVYNWDEVVSRVGHSLSR